MAISLTVSALTTYIYHFKFTYKHNILQNKPHKQYSNLLKKITMYRENICRAVEKFSIRIRLKSYWKKKENICKTEAENDC